MLGHRWRYRHLTRRFCLVKAMSLPSRNRRNATVDGVHYYWVKDSRGDNAVAFYNNQMALAQNRCSNSMAESSMTKSPTVFAMQFHMDETLLNRVRRSELDLQIAFRWRVDSTCVARLIRHNGGTKQPSRISMTGSSRMHLGRKRCSVDMVAQSLAAR